MLSFASFAECLLDALPDNLNSIHLPYAPQEYMGTML
jgi:hypothetical protein